MVNVACGSHKCRKRVFMVKFLQNFPVALRNAVALHTPAAAELEPAWQQDAWDALIHFTSKLEWVPKEVRSVYRNCFYINTDTYEVNQEMIISHLDDFIGDKQSANTANMPSDDGRPFVAEAALVASDVEYEYRKEQRKHELELQEITAGVEKHKSDNQVEMAKEATKHAKLQNDLYLLRLIDKAIVFLPVAALLRSTLWFLSGQ